MNLLDDQRTEVVHSGDDQCDRVKPGLYCYSLSYRMYERFIVPMAGRTGVVNVAAADEGE